MFQSLDTIIDILLLNVEHSEKDILITNQEFTLLLLFVQLSAIPRMDFQVKDFGYSTKNISLTSKSKYLQTLIQKTESLIQRMRWKAYFFLNPSNDEQGKSTKQAYGFKSKRTVPYVKELSEFEDIMLNTIKSIKFKYSNHTNELQKKLQKDLKEIQEDPHVYVKADKKTNYYKTKPEDYQNLLDKNVTKSYKKASTKEPDNITHTDKDIATKLKLDDRIETTPRNAPFIKLKDHKDDFTNKPQCRLINPTKSEIGIISKQILDRINKSILQSTNVNLWRSTTDTINWFKAIPDKYNHAFITFDVCEFYPSITENLLAKALNYASTLTSITKEERHIIIHAKRRKAYHHPCKKIPAIPQRFSMD